MAGELPGMSPKTPSKSAQRTQAVQARLRQLQEEHDYDLQTGFTIHRLLPGMFLEAYWLIESRL
ncbi:hypothetical protein AUK45_00740 [Candidatus Peregrinibacteria bacterium CG2_30_44_17]|nr:MAG: hypothetical protein AUK45_00740 [Candidatus Peregrinibacteria bacterium CG2_30_44_17]